MGLISPLFSLIAPFIIWPVEYLLPFPYLVEEVYKSILVLLVVNDNLSQKDQALLVVVNGVLFSISETFFYFINIYKVGSLTTVLERLISTTPLHIVTILIIFYFAKKNKKLLPIGFFVSVILHYLFNLMIGK